mmetsp:Transcript_73219/g.118098  ORF Transcript_73219/g.118098 Transcript_73219/m.118098 type:complete len:290 (-) Transcript_73219:168-1037(-)|eukprot:CAMPEP_0115139642 /NCGR_PEP_ID=MMETSP0227-20121206/58413_1 /TAXON_ID=89957 /ORGANISM="Polarella glacialis, Strain CCMP 1383" /LENGTH=289 /DNA_ID=CAMNT_0002547551 /DNA_START=126 /DNA_END=995 /DNA_ORIENTATION=+
MPPKKAQDALRQADMDEDKETEESGDDEEKEDGFAEVDDDDDEEDLEFDLEAIADKAVKQATKVWRDPGQLSLDIGIGPEQLYLGGSSSSRAPAFNTAAVAGAYRVNIKDYSQSSVPTMAASLSQGREVRGAAVRPVDDGKLRREEGKKAREEKLKSWFGLPKHKMTPELEKELKAIKLRANYDPKRFYKAHDTMELPKYFTVATEVGGGMAPVGLNTRTQEVHAYSGRSLLDEIMRDSKAQEWTTKKYGEVYEKNMASRNSGHGKRTMDGNKQRWNSGWKKTKKHGAK